MSVSPQQLSDSVAHFRIICFMIAIVKFKKISKIHVLIFVINTSLTSPSNFLNCYFVDVELTPNKSWRKFHQRRDVNVLKKRNRLMNFFTLLKVQYSEILTSGLLSSYGIALRIQAI
ncbi:unnamed protein product [Lymnaea stagnalis]|uniref:Uncharacterized protein n=1 Tax=Lymnaea stagnalis TaxID=6523 RepID=A0AAV2IEL4_LYMST